MRVVVAEKPSVARDLARVLGVSQRGEGLLQGNGLAITWCHGHMATLEEPAHYDASWKRWSLDTLPMLPEAFALTLRGNAGDQFRVIQRLLCDPGTEQVVNACDAGREGELIFRYVYELAGCTAPVKRLWVSSLTDQAIQEGWRRLRPGADFDRLAAAARSRSEADWLVGLNATRAMTCRAREAGGDGLLSVGRVQTPTLAMIVARDLEIEAFVPEDYWLVHAHMAPGEFRATWFDPAARDDKESKAGDRKDAPRAERLPAEGLAEAVAFATEGQAATVETADRKTVREPPPLLYDLTSLQRRANQRYGLSAQRTLEVAQALYEKHKLLTYPRTDARYITDDQIATLPDVLRAVGQIPVYVPFVTALMASPRLTAPGSRVVNAAEVGDHHAILPTPVGEGRTAPSALPPDEKRIYDLVARRFMAALSEEAVFDVSRLVLMVEPGSPLPEEVAAPLRFRARGRVCRQAGWRDVDPPSRKRNDVDLPPVEPGDPLVAERAEVAKGQTRPPRPHNDASILAGMETAGKVLDDRALARALRGKGLGTPATRAAILQTLLDRSFVVRKGRDLRATDQGRALIAAVPVEALKNAELTGEWEGQLAEMADGRGAGRPSFMSAVRDYVTTVVDAIRLAPAPALLTQAPTTPSLGTCPACGKPVRKRGKVWTCDQGRACSFVVFSTMSRREISGRMVKQLLTSGRSQPVKGFVSRAGRPFSAGLEWNTEESRVTFWFPEERDDRPAAPRR